MFKDLNYEEAIVLDGGRSEGSYRSEAQSRGVVSTPESQRSATAYTIGYVSVVVGCIPGCGYISAALGAFGTLYGCR